MGGVTAGSEISDRDRKMLKLRLISGLAMGGSFLLAMAWMPAAGTLAVLLALGVGGQVEFYRMLRNAGIPAFTVVGTLAGTALLAVGFLQVGPCRGGMDGGWERIVLVVTLLAVFIRQFPQKYNTRPFETMGCTLLGVWYVPFLLGFFADLMYTWESGGWGPMPATGRILVLYLVVVVKLSDIGAYTAGSLFGRHKMIPRLSPNKTWEGFAGGILLSVAASVCFSIALGGWLGKVPLPLGHAAFLGILLGGTGVVGDLFESLLKRASSTKDSSAAVPGMGGLLDVLDSLLFAAPVLYVYIGLILSK
jgi:phosphatidate cytidylyltransferase